MLLRYCSVVDLLLCVFLLLCFSICRLGFQPLSRSEWPTGSLLYSEPASSLVTIDGAQFHQIEFTKLAATPSCCKHTFLQVKLIQREGNVRDLCLSCLDVSVFENMSELIQQYFD